jgi:hypothetical protein
VHNVSFIIFPLFQSVLLATVSVLSLSTVAHIHLSVGGHAMRCVHVVAAVSVSPDESRGANLKMCGMAHNARVGGAPVCVPLAPCMHASSVRVGWHTYGART